ncbi:DDE superfamily endonuclease, CENP-B-like protein [Metarhizium robertsii ARSEF 23]|uniref:Uncharacterized protein n=2 Tax=Metarhizium TaxID=5529 RepID=A0A5C6FYR6_METRR|nr:DDE superfamily endonuclease, CENP-B-like protein [Metarhizium robertsii ARSEF 23]KHO11391.1 DDE superfamily endonuclease, CENP-B-like protein [Metarhizium robertsii ARSEF 23]TWU70710.1 hypothetical protein ED733_001773 [Metarhizium rileyi]
MSEASAAALYAMSGVLIGVSVITVTMRFYARRCQKAPLLADDWLLIPSLITFIGTCACIFYGGHIQVFGYSTHDFTPEQLKATKERSAKVFAPLTPYSK